MEAPQSPTPLEHAARRDAERRSERRALGPALVASAVLHLAVLSLLTFSSDPQHFFDRVPPQRIIEIEPAMQALDIAPVTTEPAPVEVQLAERRRATEPVQVRPPAFGQPAAAEPMAPAERREPGARNRLEYRMGSAEVWRPQAPLPPEALSDDEIVRRRLAGRLGEYNDSVAGEAAALARSRDWTVTGEDGQRWGVSPGQVHLGSVTIPVPFELPTSPEVAGRVRSWTEIQQQAARVEGREIFDDRVRAIRERADQERARRNTATTNTPDGGGN